MKKTVSFTKNLEFPSMIGDITEITLEDNLKFVDSNSVSGNFYIGGKYKMTDASMLEEDFSFNLPVDISVLERLDVTTSKVSVSDFTYKVVDGKYLKADIEVLIEGIEIIDEEDKKEELVEVRNCEVERECDGDSKEEKEIEIPVKEDKKIDIEKDQVEEKKEVEDYKFEEKKEIEDEIEMPKDDTNKLDDYNTNSLFSNLADEDDSFATYSIYIMREGDTIQNVIDKYNVSKEMLEEYNDLSKISINSKVIVPSSINE